MAKHPNKGDPKDKEPVAAPKEEASPPPLPARLSRDDSRRELLATRRDFVLVAFEGKEFALVRPNARQHADIFARGRRGDAKESDGLLLLIQALIATVHTVDSAGQPHEKVFDQVDVAALEESGSDKHSILNVLGVQALNYVLEKGDFGAVRKN